MSEGAWRIGGILLTGEIEVLGRKPVSTTLFTTNLTVTSLRVNRKHARSVDILLGNFDL